MEALQKVKGLRMKITIPLVICSMLCISLSAMVGVFVSSLCWAFTMFGCLSVWWILTGYLAYLGTKEKDNEKH